MIFASIEFGLYIIIVFIIYWFVARRNTTLQNAFLLAAGYVFYAWWDWRFLFLLIGVSTFNYLIGRGIDNYPAAEEEELIDAKAARQSRNRKLLLIIGVIANVLVLGVFKYYNFFIDSFIQMVAATGYDLPRSTTRFVLPVGISFYTFLSLSYIIDIYRETIKAEKSLMNVLLTLSFFPIIFAGPIQRPSTLLPQIKMARVFTYDRVVDGMRQFLWGAFAKLVLADQLAPFVADFFGNETYYSGSTLAMGLVFFGIQLYADFSGYSNMAIGIGSILGFRLMQNFNYPYFGRDITDYWKRWHISLTSWFRDYFFMPLSFTISYHTKSKKVLFIRTDLFVFIVASLITWMLTGLWHGANFTFMYWGLINGVLLVIYYLQRKPRKELFRKYGINNNNTALVIFERFFNLGVILLGLVFFRAENLSHALSFFTEMFDASLFTIPQFIGIKRAMLTTLLCIIFFIIEWKGRANLYPLEKMTLPWVKPVRYAFYYVIILVIFLFGGAHQQFIYFQF